MPLIKISNSKSTLLTSERYASESELEELLERNPVLLAGDGEPALALVTRQFRLAGSGIADLFFVDAEGLPVLVEVKLAKNPQSRREVIAQVFDYAASLSEMTVDEVDSETDGRLENALRALCKDEVEWKAKWRNLGTNLRAGQARVIVAVDMESEDLSRIVQYLADHTDLDVRLVVVEKYSDDSADRIYSSTTVIAADTEKVAIAESNAVPSPGFSEVLDAWTSQSTGPLRLEGSDPSWRLIRPNAWPNSLHYEFNVNEGDKIGAEIHLEDGRVTHLVGLLRELAGELAPRFAQATCTYDCEWNEDGGRLLVLHERDCPPATVAANMHLLILLTQERITKALQVK